MDKFKKTRLIISSILLIIIVGSWTYLAISNHYKNELTVLKRFINNNKDIFKDIDIKDNIKLNYKDNYLGLYTNYKNNEMIIYNNKSYYNINKNKYSINKQELLNKDNYNTIYTSIINSIIKNKQNINVSKTKTSSNYIYHYSINNLKVITSTLKTDKNFTSTLKKILNINNDELNDLLDNISNRRLELTLNTKGFKRNVISYSIKLENCFNIIVNNNYKGGYILGIGFKIQDDTIILNNELNDITIDSINYDSSFDKNKLKEITDFNLESFLNF